MNIQIINKLQKAWELSPTLKFGHLIESIENIAWQRLEQAHMRSYSARLINLPDDFFEAALDQWISIPFVRQTAKI